ncbi:MAG: SAM-dependent methyltransferase [Opitutaceae bacterium]|nr:SAM-dependent methyltransferase [Opitutaceae bacterium]
MARESPLLRFQSLLSSAFGDGTLIKLTLGKPAPGRRDPGLRNLYVRPVILKSGPHCTLVYRYATKDITKNLSPAAALEQVRAMLGVDFLDAHLFTPLQSAQIEIAASGEARLREKVVAQAPASSSESHDREKRHTVPSNARWLHALGVTNAAGRPREGMSAKLRQIQKFTEILEALLIEAGLVAPPMDGAPGTPPPPFTIADMGCGKGYLTFAAASVLGSRARVVGVETRENLVKLCSEVARQTGMESLSFVQGDIASVELPGNTGCEVLIALHACDTATDDALARGIAAGARLLVVSPCCQKELRPQMQSPAILADALRYGIFLERQAEFVTDALRAQLLEWAGYRTKVFEFVSTEHTARNIMIAAIKDHPRGQQGRLHRLRNFAGFYGVRSQALARHLGVDLAAEEVS